MKVLGIDHEYTTFDGKTVGEPMRAAYLTRGFAPLLNWASERFGGEGVIVLSGESADLLGLPDKCPVDGAPEDPVLTAARDSGWDVSGLHPFTVFTRDKGAVRVIVLTHDWLKDGDCPLWSPVPEATANHLAEWHTVTGAAWVGTNAGVSGHHLARAIVKPKKTPKWVYPEEEIRSGWGRSELWYSHKQWSNPMPGRYLVEMDANRNYLAAMQSVLLAPGVLRYRAAKDGFDPKMAGFWLVDLEPWTMTELPDPAGYPTATVKRGKRELRWVSTPTLQLIRELHDEGVHGGYTLIEAYVAEGVQLLRPWAAKLRDTMYGDASQPVRDGAYLAYKRSVGLLNKPGGRIHRPDWYSAIVAHARCNTFRRARQALAAGWAPLKIETDAVYYTSDHPTEYPTTFPVKDGLGGFTVKITDLAPELQEVTV